MSDNEKKAQEPTEPSEEMLTAPVEETLSAEASADPIEEPTPPLEEVDYAALAASDLAEIKRLSRDFAEVEHLSELPFARRFAELRDLGLSVKEALAAVTPLREGVSGKSHLRSAVPRPSYIPEDSLSHEEMRKAKDLFYGLSEKEINALYRRVKQ